MESLLSRGPPSLGGVEHPLAGKALLLKRFKENQNSYWKTVFDGRRSALVWVVHVNRNLIYTELGAYDGERFGTLCE